METQKLHEQKAPKKAQSQQPRLCLDDNQARQSLLMSVPRQSLGTSSRTPSARQRDRMALHLPHRSNHQNSLLHHEP